MLSSYMDTEQTHTHTVGIIEYQHTSICDLVHSKFRGDIASIKAAQSIILFRRVDNQLRECAYTRIAYRLNKYPISFGLESL